MGVLSSGASLPKIMTALGVKTWGDDNVAIEAGEYRFSKKAGRVFKKKPALLKWRGIKGYQNYTQTYPDYESAAIELANYMGRYGFSVVAIDAGVFPGNYAVHVDFYDSSGYPQSSDVSVQSFYEGNSNGLTIDPADDQNVWELASVVLA